MSNEAVYVSVVVPMYNEAECVEEFHRRAKAALEELGKPYELVIVDDGSSDGTAEALRGICSRDKAVVGVFLSRNRGQSAALSAGFRHSKGEFVVVMDGDLQNMPEEIGLLLDANQGAAMAKGIRQGRSESKFIRLIPSRIANWAIRKTTKCEIRDMGGFSCMRGDIARSLRLRSGQHRFLPALVYIMGGRIVQVPVTAQKRFAGTSHYGIGRFIDVFLDITMLWFQTANKGRPVYLFGRVSLASFAAASLLFLWTLADKVFRGADMANRPPFFISILLFLAALGFLSTGFILEVLTGAVEAENGGYVVRETANYEEDPI